MIHKMTLTEHFGHSIKEYVLFRDCYLPTTKSFNNILNTFFKRVLSEEQWGCMLSKGSVDFSTDTRFMEIYYYQYEEK